MAWGVVGNFLEKFSNLKLTKSFYGEEISEVIKDVLGIEIDSKNINYKNGVILIKTKNSAVKNEIFINKSKILKNFSKKIIPLMAGQELKPNEIRFLN